MSPLCWLNHHLINGILLFRPPLLSRLGDWTKIEAGNHRCTFPFHFDQECRGGENSPNLTFCFTGAQANKNLLFPGNNESRGISWVHQTEYQFGFHISIFLERFKEFGIRAYSSLFIFEFSDFSTAEMACFQARKGK